MLNRQRQKPITFQPGNLFAIDQFDVPPLTDMTRYYEPNFDQLLITIYTTGQFYITPGKSFVNTATSIRFIPPTNYLVIPYQHIVGFFNNSGVVTATVFVVQSRGLEIEFKS